MRSSGPGRATAVAILVCVGACGTVGSDVRPGEEHDFDVLIPADFEPVPNHSVLEVIRQLRPRWLHGRGPSIGIDRSRRLVVEGGEGRVKAYLDGIRLDVRRLDLLPVRDVIRMRFLSATEATLRYGTDHEAGAILVTTRAY